MLNFGKNRRIKPKSFKVKSGINGISSYIFLSIFGTLLWILTYICLYFYKEFFLCYIKSHIKFKGKSYLLNLKEYKSYLPRIFIFNFILVFLWVIILFMNSEYRNYIIKSGFICFIILYIIYWSVYYKNNKSQQGFFDDFYTIFHFIKNEFLNKKDNDITDDKKEKKE